MQTKSLFLASFLAVLLLVGAGCANQPDGSDSEANDQMMKKDTSEHVEDGDSTEEMTEDEGSEAADGEFTSFTSDSGVTLNVKVTKADGGPNNQVVDFKWEATEEIEETVEGWYIVHGWEENPENPSTYRYIRGAAHHAWEWNNATFWEGMREGTAHFRVCALVANECVAYSNNVTVEVLGPTGAADGAAAEEAEESDE